jgi:hypothetical protein
VNPFTVQTFGVDDVIERTPSPFVLTVALKLAPNVAFTGKFTMDGAEAPRMPTAVMTTGEVGCAAVVSTEVATPKSDVA